MAASRVMLCLVLWIATSAAGGEWPQWGGTDCRNMVSSETGLPDTFVARPRPGDTEGTLKNVKWMARMGSAAYGNPTVAGGRVFVGTDDQTVEDDPRFTRARGGLVKCFDESTGKLLWQLVVPERTNVPKEFLYGQQHLGICSSPAIDGDRAYVMTSAAEILCLDVHGQANGNDGPYVDEGKYMVPRGKPAVKLTSADGDIIWRYDLIEQLKVCPHDTTSCSVLLHGDALYVSTCNGVDKSHEVMLNPKAPAFIALDKNTGKLLATEDEGISKRLFHCQWSSPSLGMVNGKPLVFLGGGDGICYAFEALTSVPAEPVKLKLAWSFDCNPPSYRLRDGKPIRYTDGDKRKRTSPNKNDGLYVGPSDIIGTPVFHNNRIYVALGQDPAHGRGKGRLCCIDATKTGDITKTGLIWSYDGLDRTIATAAVSDDLVYITDIAGRMHCVDAETGKPYWVYETKAETWGGPLIADGRIYFGNQRDFYVMAAGKEARLISKVPLGSPAYSTPVVANKVMYIASSRFLWAVTKQ